MKEDRSTKNEIIKKKESQKFVHLSLRIKPDVYEDLKILAKSNYRSLNKEVDYLIRMAIADMKES